MTVPKKPTWQERVKEVLAYHIQCMHKDRYWTIKKTAKELNRSVGSVSQDINLAYFIRSHPQVENLRTYVQALEWMKAKRHSIKVQHWR